MVTVTKTAAKNPLLVKITVGKTRPSVYDLPKEGHVYGIVLERNPDECAATVLQHWETIKTIKKQDVTALDYIAMNRNTAKEGIITAKGAIESRKKNPVHVKIGSSNSTRRRLFTSSLGNPGEHKPHSGPLPSDKDTQFTYGQPTRPSTPVAFLMTDTTQRNWIAEQERRQKEVTDLAKAKAQKKHNKTISTIQRVKAANIKKKDTHPSFRLKQFTNIPSKTITSRPSDDPAMAKIKAQVEKLKLQSTKTSKPSVGSTTAVKSESHAKKVTFEKA